MNTDTLLAGEDRGVWELAAPEDGQKAGPAAVRAAQDDGYLTETQAVAELAGLADALEVRESAQREIVDRLGRLVRSGRIEQLEGLTPELLLKLKHAQSGLDCWLLLTAVEVLARMPATARLYRQGLLSWSQVCQIVSRVRRLPVESMGIIDRRIDASADVLDALGPDGLEAAVDSAVREVQGPERAEKDEARARTDGFVHLQPKLFGGIKLYGEYDDPVEAATIVNGLDAAAATAERNAHHATDPDADADEGDGEGRQGRRRSWWWGRGLLDLCEHDLAGHDGQHRRQSAKPLVLVHVDVANATVTDAGNVEINLPGVGLPPLTRKRLEEILSTDHDLRVVLFDDGRPLATSDLIHADDIPTKTRIAVRARDRGCRFDGRTPAARAHQHHLDGRTNGHPPDRIITVGPWAHLRAIHRRGWHPEPQHGGIIRWRRGNSTFRTLPWATPLRRPPDEHDP